MHGEVRQRQGGRPTGEQRRGDGRAEAALGVVVLGDHDPAAGIGHRAAKGLAVDRLDGVAADDPGADTVPLQEVGGAQAGMQRDGAGRGRLDTARWSRRPRIMERSCSAICVKNGGKSQMAGRDRAAELGHRRTNAESAASSACAWSATTSPPARHCTANYRVCDRRGWSSGHAWNSTALPHASVADTTSRSPIAWYGTALPVSNCATSSRSATSTVKPTSDGSAGAISPGRTSASA